jgi:DNA-binding response OmpR family regulator
MPKKILLVEKDEFYVEVIGTFVKLFLQHHLEVVQSAAVAYERVRTDRPDLVLLDLESGTESLEFAEKMRDDASTKRVPILALSQSESKRDDALGRGCVAFLTKPFRVRELEAHIDRLLDLP